MSASYQPPSGGGNPPAPTMLAPKKDDIGPTISYLCADCGVIGAYQALAKSRCMSCGGRVLYKMRTKRMIQFEAR